MKRLAPIVVLFALLVLACGAEDKRTPQGTGGTGGAGGFAPAFDGLASVTYDPSTSSARLSWLPATDTETPAEEISYVVHVWYENPEKGGKGSTYPWTKGIESCRPDCRYSFALASRNVTWFAVEATDGHEMSAGLDVVLPELAANETDTPTIAAVTPATAYVGVTEVVLTGQNFFDEITSADALTLGGKPIDPNFITGWENLRISFRVPAGFSSGSIGVKTLRGSATAELEVLE